MASTMSHAIKQNTLGQSEGAPGGVPTSYNWYKGWNLDGIRLVRAGAGTPADTRAELLNQYAAESMIGTVAAETSPEPSHSGVTTADTLIRPLALA